MTVQKMAYTIAETSQALMMSEAHIRRQIKANNIPIIQLGHRYSIPAWWIDETLGQPDAAA